MTKGKGALAVADPLPAAPVPSVAAVKAVSGGRPERDRKAQGAVDVAPGRVTRDPQRTSAAVLAAAVKEFTEKGYGGARINEIARRAGVNKRMLYHYFGGKEALYLAVLEGSYVAIRSAERRLHLADRDPVEGMRELALFTWTYVLDHPEFPSILATENLHKAKYLKRSARIFDLHSPLIGIISDLVRRGAQNGQFRADADPVDVYITIASLAFFYWSNRWTLSTIFRRDLMADASLKAWGEHIASTVVASLRPV